MKITKLTVFLAILLISVMAIGTVSAESYDGSVSVDDSVSAIVLGSTYTVNDDTYSDYFDEYGVLKDSVNEGDELIIGSLSNKDLVINKAITLNGNGVGTITNGSITIGDGSTIDGAIIKNLLINDYSKNCIILNSNALNTLITGNQISLVTAGSGWDSFSAIYSMGYVENTTIVNNDVKVTGTAPYNYAIDANGYGIITGNPTGFKILNNSIEVDVTNYGAAIYLDSPTNSVIDGNEISVSGATDACPVYGIATADSSLWDISFNSPKNIVVSNNKISAKSVDSVYAMEFFGGNDFIISDNKVDATTEGGAFGIGIGDVSGATISNNEVSVSGVLDKGYCWDSLGTGHAGIFLQGVSNAIVKDNHVESTYGAGEDFAVLVKQSSNVSVEDNYLISNNGLNKANAAVGVENSTDILIENNLPDDSSDFEPENPTDEGNDVVNNSNKYADVNMENTGLPIVVLILALLSVIGLGYKKY
ncbi:MAG: right-handed parallel beta-helix repeat-containing protein [Methanobacteriaceae archaeon]|nr:right-handed parallel beta-helix repeat-containing protein [Methanobacteriaceae archaeon]